MLRDAWRALGGDLGLVRLVSSDGDPGLSSPFAVGALALGAVGAQRLAAEELAAEESTGAEPTNADQTDAEPADENSTRRAHRSTHARRGRRSISPVILDARQVGFAFRSERYFMVDGVPGGQGFAPLSRFLPTSDGWVRLHANYPQHRAAIGRALGAEPAGAAAERTSEEVEDAVVAAGGVAAKVRTAEEWGYHPQGAAVRGLPLLRLRQVATGPTRVRPLHGLRVLDLTRVIAGPIGTRTLASYGADVLRVDSPRSPEDPAGLLETGPGKRHVQLDLADRADRARFERLLDEADVLVQGYRPGALARFGLHPDDLAERRPGLIVVSLSAWGATGPWAERRGFDSIVQAATGIADRTRDASRTPGVLPAQALDHGAGHLIAATVLRAVTQTRREGGTWHGELSLAQLAAWLLAAPRTPAAGPDASSDSSGSTELAPYLVDLPSRSGTLTLVRPPGSPTWSRGPLPVAPEHARWLGPAAPAAASILAAEGPKVP